MNPYRAVSCVSTKSMFVFLLRLLHPDLILDVGSRDGRDALRFRHYAPDARIIAIEANPDLHAKMAANPDLRRANIETRQFAASNSEGSASFTIFNAKKGTGSLRQKLRAQPVATHTVPTARLDGISADATRRIALWIDVEGVAYEALEGAAGMMDSVVLIHTEIEAQELFAGQRTSGDVYALLASHGFTFLDGGTQVGRRSGNAVFVRSDIASRLSVLMPVLAYKCYSRVAAYAGRNRTAPATQSASRSDAA